MRIEIANKNPKELEEKKDTSFIRAYMKALLIVFCFICPCLISYSETVQTPSINDIMSLEDQKSTGVIHLTQEQKKALAEWFVKHGYYEIQAQVNYNQALTVALNVGAGQKLMLSDNTVWEVASEDQETASSWIGSVRVELTPSGNAAYPFMITNIQTRTSVKVKKSTL